MQVTMISAGILGLLLVVLSLRISQLRRADHVSMGDGGIPALQERIRAQGNCTEYVPTGLILIFLAEQGYGPTWFVVALAVLFVAARLAHPIGMGMPAPNAARLFGALGTYGAIALLAAIVLVKAVTL